MRNVVFLTLLTSFLWGIDLNKSFSQGLETQKEAPEVPKYRSFLGATVGAISVEDDPSLNMIVGTFYDFAVSRNFLMGATFDYWRAEYETDDDIEIDVNDMALGINSKLVFTATDESFRPYIGAGVAVHRLALQEAQVIESEDPTIDETRDETTDIEGQFGIDLVAGLMYYIHREVDVMAQIRYRDIVEESVNFDQLAFNAGVAYKL